MIRIDHQLQIAFIDNVLCVKWENEPAQKIEAIFLGSDAINLSNRFMQSRGYEYTVYAVDDDDLIILVNKED